MSAQPRPDRLAAALLACAAFAFSWTLVNLLYDERAQIVDTPVYERYGSRMEDGDVPYRDFRVEYPPGALPVFALPALVSDDGGGYRAAFELLMLACGIAATAAAAWAGAGRAALGVVAVSPLLLGPVVLTRFDLLPAALAAFAVAALVRERERLGFALLGLATLVKLWPAVIAPVALAGVWRRRGRDEALRCAALLAAVVALPMLVFLAIAPEGFLASFSRQLARPLQIETLGAAALIVSPADVEMVGSHGSQNLEGTGVWAVALAQSVLQLAAIAWVWWAAWRGRLALVTAAAAAVVAFVALGKVLSPQFLIWLVPLVPLVRARRGVAASALLVAAALLTQLWFPYRYWDYARELDAGIAWIVLARDLVLVALFAVLARPGRAPARSP